jgi:hypothetical protein
MTGLNIAMTLVSPIDNPNTASGRPSPSALLDKADGPFEQLRR